MANASMDYNDSLVNSTNSSQAFDASCWTVTTTDQQLMISIRIFVGASLTFVGCGLIGNTLSILVFSSAEMRQMSSNVYLLALAVSDSLYLVSVLLGRLMIAVRCWVFPSTQIDFVNRSQFFCVLQQYLSDLFADYSTCLILAFTVERGLAVFYPVAFKQRCTVARARIVCTVMFVVIATCIAPYHAVMIGLYHEYHICTIYRHHEEAFSALYFAEMIVLRVTPVVAIAVLNALIVQRVTRITHDKRKRRRHITLLPIDCQHQTDRLRQRGSVVANGISGRRVSVVMRQRVRRPSLDERNLQLTIILILVSATYILFYLPVLVHFTIHKMTRSGIVDLSESFLDVFGNYAKTLHVAGFAINFLLYTVSGRVFREQLVALLCRTHCCGPAAGYRLPETPETASSNVPAVLSAF